MKCTNCDRKLGSREVVDIAQKHTLEDIILTRKTSSFLETHSLYCRHCLTEIDKKTIEQFISNNTVELCLIWTFDYCCSKEEDECNYVICITVPWDFKLTFYKPLFVDRVEIITKDDIHYYWTRDREDFRLTCIQIQGICTHLDLQVKYDFDEILEVTKRIDFSKKVMVLTQSLVKAEERKDVLRKVIENILSKEKQNGAC